MTIDIGELTGMIDIGNITDQIQRVVVTDIRYPNEANWLRGLGGWLIWIERPGVGPVNGHSCETIDVTIFDSVNCPYNQDFVKAVAHFSPTNLRVFALMLVALAEKCESLAEELGVDDQ